MPMHYIGIAGFPRRYYAWTAFDAFAQFGDLNRFISLAAIAVFLAQFIFLANFFHSIWRGRRASQNSWQSNTLEWTTPPRANPRQLTRRHSGRVPLALRLQQVRRGSRLYPPNRAPAANPGVEPASGAAVAGPDQQRLARAAG